MSFALLNPGCPMKFETMSLQSTTTKFFVWIEIAMVGVLSCTFVLLCHIKFVSWSQNLECLLCLSLHYNMVNFASAFFYRPPSSNVEILSPFVQHYSLHFSLHQVVQSVPTQKPRKPRLIWKYAQADCDSSRAMIEATDWDVHFVPSDSTPLLKEQKDLIEKQNREEQHAHHPCTIPVSTNHPLHPHETITVSSERCRDSPLLSTWEMLSSQCSWWIYSWVFWAHFSSSTSLWWGSQYYCCLRHALITLLHKLLI